MDDFIIVTGGAGFIGSAVVWKLNKVGIENIIIVDSLGNSDKWKNLVKLKISDYIEKDDFLNNLLQGKYDNLSIDTIFHLGACSSTILQDKRYYIKNNFEYSKYVAQFAFRKNARFIYASSAATYGDGSLGFSDDESKLESLKPLNMYGFSKHVFDLWIKKHGFLDKVVGLKYFNVFGPNEYHKQEMRSFVVKAVEQIKAKKEVRLFKSYLPEYANGEQKRDFIYVKDAVDMSLFFYFNRDIFGIYNIGSGIANTFNDLVNAVFDALSITPTIKYIDMPLTIKEQYQYFTKADIEKIRSKGYKQPITDLKAAVHEYVVKYILKEKYLSDYDK